MASIPLFPLGTVLFPGGVLPLRIFETRYMDMVRECMRNQQPFGVILITAGKEIGKAASHETTGTLANIVDFDMEQQGLLLIRSLGGRRFKVESTTTSPSELILAQIELIDEDPLLPVPAEFSGAVELLKRVVSQLDEETPEESQRPMAKPYLFNDCGWVSNRLCEILPLPSGTKHRFMALEDPLARLQLVHHYLVQKQVLERS